MVQSSHSASVDDGQGLNTTQVQGLLSATASHLNHCNNNKKCTFLLVYLLVSCVVAYLWSYVSVTENSAFGRAGKCIPLLKAEVLTFL